MTALVRFLFRLLPLGIVLYAMRDGADRAKDVYWTAVEAVETVQTQVDMGSAVRLLELELAGGGPPPSDLAAFLRQNLDKKGGDPALDRWGEPYRIGLRGRGVTLISCGPDLECGNDDDVVARVETER